MRRYDIMTDKNSLEGLCIIDSITNDIVVSGIEPDKKTKTSAWKIAKQIRDEMNRQDQSTVPLLAPVVA